MQTPATRHAVALTPDTIEFLETNLEIESDTDGLHDASRDCLTGRPTRASIDRVLHMIDTGGDHCGFDYESNTAADLATALRAAIA